MKISVSGPIRVEHDIRPPMPVSVTIPFAVDEGGQSWAIYVTHNAFADVQPTDAEVAVVAKEIKRRLGLGERLAHP